MTQPKKTRFTFALVAAALLGSAGLAAANGTNGGNGRTQTPAPARAEMLKRFDKNGDGQLDDAERKVMRAALKTKMQEHRAKTLAKFDGNKDGQLDDGERAIMQDERATKMFGKLDVNGDGVVTLAEFKQARPMKHFGHGGRGRH